LPAKAIIVTRVRKAVHKGAGWICMVLDDMCAV